MYLSSSTGFDPLEKTSLIVPALNKHDYRHRFSTCTIAVTIEQSLEGKANHVLSIEVTRQMLTPGIGHWGLGLEIGGTDSNPYFSHGGANEGFRNIFVAYEKNGDGAVVMTNSDAGS